jgi:hypothetical protein
MTHAVLLLTSGEQLNQILTWYQTTQTILFLKMIFMHITLGWLELKTLFLRDLKVTPIGMMQK